MARFIDLLGYREITLKSDTDPAIIAIRNREAEICKAEVATEDAVKGVTPTSGLIENTVMLIRGITRKIKCRIESSTREEPIEDVPILPWLVEHAGSSLFRCQKGRDGRNTIREIARQDTVTRVCLVWREKVGEAILNGPLEQNNPRYKIGIWLGMRNNNEELFVGAAEGVVGAREIRRLGPQSRSHKETTYSAIGVQWQREVRVDPIPISLLPSAGARIQRERITKQDLDEFGATVRCPRLQHDHR